MEKKGTITFKNVSWPHKMARTGRAEIQIKIADKPKGTTLSICAMAYEGQRREPFMVGQCLKEMMASSLRNDPLFREIYGYWKEYHLNDMHAGTPAQEALIKEGLNDGRLKSMNYKVVCGFLDENNMLFDGEYHYGTKWLYEPIPDNVLRRLEEIIDDADE